MGGNIAMNILTLSFLDNVEFLAEHRYFTEYGKEVLEWKKEKNIERLLEQL